MHDCTACVAVPSFFFGLSFLLSVANRHHPKVHGRLQYADSCITRCVECPRPRSNILRACLPRVLVDGRFALPRPLWSRQMALALQVRRRGGQLRLLWELLLRRRLPRAPELSSVPCIHRLYPVLRRLSEPVRGMVQPARRAGLSLERRTVGTQNPIRLRANMQVPWADFPHRGRWSPHAPPHSTLTTVYSSMQGRHPVFTLKLGSCNEPCTFNYVADAKRDTKQASRNSLTHLSPAPPRRCRYR